METAPQARLLVVEDDVIVRGLLAARLRKVGYLVETAENGRAGLELARRHRPELILTDWMMPEMDGVEMVRALRADPDLRRTHLILLTSKDDRTDRIAGLDLGADDYLAKPWADEDLLAHVRAGLRIRRLQQELTAAEHKAALVTMAATLGHEINNPLTVLSGSLQLARQRPPTGTEFYQLLDRCQAQVDRIAKVVLGLKQLSDPQLTTYLGTANMLDLREER